MLKHTAVTAAIAAVLSGVAASDTASARDSFAPRAVALNDASDPPTFLRLLKPGRGYADLRQCGQETDHGPSARYSDMSAYRWNGRALGAQRRTRTGAHYWRDRRGGRVTFDGVVWQNRTRHAVLIAGWCD